MSLLKRLFGKNDFGLKEGIDREFGAPKAWPDPPPILPPFSGTMRCPKCGRTVTEADYCNGKFLRVPARGESPWRACRFGIGEHLHRKCSCGYTWGEATMDADRRERR